MKIKVTGYNIWGGHKIFIHKKLTEMDRPTPAMTRDRNGKTIYSELKGEHFDEPKEITLKIGMYVMLLLQSDLIRDGDQACGHNHYYDGKRLRSVYTKMPCKEDLS